MRTPSASIRSALRAISLLALLLAAQAAELAHPFLLWTPEEALAIRKRLDGEAWAKERWQQMQGEGGTTFRNLFSYQILGEAKAGDAERKKLISFIGTNPDHKEFTRHFDNYLAALRYDVLYDSLTPEQRSGVEDTFRAFIKDHLDDKFVYTRTSWLPNMQWPKPMAAHLMAVALRDRPLIEAMFASNGGWKWYFDDYIADGWFYMEEWAKHQSMIGEMLLWCRGLDRLGMPEMGYAYTGRHGATMRRYIESIHRVGWPRTDLGSGRPAYDKMTMGDARPGSPYVIDQAYITGFLANGEASAFGANAGSPFWFAANMQARDHSGAKVEKMGIRHWFEIAAVKWPDAGFDYFLAQMRDPADERYRPMLYWGLDPVDPAAAAAHAPAAPSYVARERGFALLRWNETPAYWSSAEPAAALQLATYYVHYVHDCFALLGYHAFNRAIYFNRGIADGYAGDDPWTDSVRGHCGVVVDNQQAQPVGEVPTRSAFGPLVKFVWARAQALPGGASAAEEGGGDAGAQRVARENSQARQIYAGVDLSRALFLTKEYLFDATTVTSATAHSYHWQVHGPGQALLERPADWSPSADLDNGRLYEGCTNAALLAKLHAGPPGRWDLKQVRKSDPAGASWSAGMIQGCALADPAASKLGAAWYARKIGVRMTMLGQPGLSAYIGDTPIRPRKPEEVAEAGGTTILAAVTGTTATFAALHEPFIDGTPRSTAFRRIQQNDDGIAVAATSPGAFDDRLMVASGEDAARVVTLGDAGESFTFADHAYLRITPQRILASGDLRACRLAWTAPGLPVLELDGKELPVQRDGAWVVFTAR